MNGAKAPRSIRAEAASGCGASEVYSRRRVSVVAGTSAVTSFSGAEAQPTQVAAVPFPHAGGLADKNATTLTEAVRTTAGVTLGTKRYHEALYQSATPFALVAPGRSASLVVSARY